MKMLWLQSLKDALEGKAKPEEPESTVAFKLKQEASEENTKNHLKLLECFDNIEGIEVNQEKYFLNVQYFFLIHNYSFY